MPQSGRRPGFRTSGSPRSRPGQIPSPSRCTASSPRHWACMRDQSSAAGHTDRATPIASGTNPRVHRHTACWTTPRFVRRPGSANPRTAREPPSPIRAGLGRATAGPIRSSATCASSRRPYVRIDGNPSRCRRAESNSSYASWGGGIVLLLLTTVAETAVGSGGSGDVRGKSSSSLRQSPKRMPVGIGKISAGQGTGDDQTSSPPGRARLRPRRPARSHAGAPPSLASPSHRTGRRAPTVLDDNLELHNDARATRRPCSKVVVDATAPVRDARVRESATGNAGRAVRGKSERFADRPIVTHRSVCPRSLTRLQPEVVPRDGPSSRHRTMPVRRR
jgi:hypothetical protein